MSSSDNRKALHQLLVLVAAAAVLAGVGRWWSGRPADSRELRVVAEELESQTAELQFLRRRESRELPVEFRSEHERQLARNFDRTSHELETLAVLPALQSRKGELVDLVHELAPIFAPFSWQPGSAEDTAPLAAFRVRLHEQERALAH